MLETEGRRRRAGAEPRASWALGAHATKVSARAMDLPGLELAVLAASYETASSVVQEPGVGIEHEDHPCANTCGEGGSP